MAPPPGEGRGGEGEGGEGRGERGGAHPEAVCLLTVQHGIQGHLPRELVYGEDPLGLLVHAGPLDAVDDAAQLLLVRLDLWGR